MENRSPPERVLPACRQLSEVREGNDFPLGVGRNRTGDKAFAEPCLTTWPRRRGKSIVFKMGGHVKEFWSCQERYSPGARNSRFYQRTGARRLRRQEERGRSPRASRGKIPNPSYSRIGRSTRGSEFSTFQKSDGKSFPSRTSLAGLPAIV